MWCLVQYRSKFGDMLGTCAAAAAQDMRALAAPLVGMGGEGFRAEIITKRQRRGGIGFPVRGVVLALAVGAPIRRYRQEGVGITADFLALADGGEFRHRRGDAFRCAAIAEIAGDRQMGDGGRRLRHGLAAAQPAGTVFVQGPGDPDRLAEFDGGGRCGKPFGGARHGLADEQVDIGRQHLGLLAVQRQEMIEGADLVRPVAAE